MPGPGQAPRHQRETDAGGGGGGQYEFESAGSRAKPKRSNMDMEEMSDRLHDINNQPRCVISVTIVVSLDEMMVMWMHVCVLQSI